MFSQSKTHTFIGSERQIFLKNVDDIHVRLQHEIPAAIKALETFHISTSNSLPHPHSDNAFALLLKQCIEQIDATFLALKNDQKTIQNAKFINILRCNQSPINLQLWVMQKKNQNTNNKQDLQPLHSWEKEGYKLLQEYLQCPVCSDAVEIPEIKQLVSCIDILKKFHSAIHSHFPTIWEVYETFFYIKHDNAITTKDALITTVQHKIQKTCRLLIASYKTHRFSKWSPRMFHGSKFLENLLKKHGNIWITGLSRPPFIHTELESAHRNKIKTSRETITCDYNMNISTTYGPHENLIITAVSVIDTDSDDEIEHENKMACMLAGMEEPQKTSNSYVNFQACSEIDQYGHLAPTYTLHYEDFCQNILAFDYICADMYTLQKGEYIDSKNNDRISHLQKSIPQERWFPPKLNKSMKENNLSNSHIEEQSVNTDHEELSSNENSPIRFATQEKAGEVGEAKNSISTKRLRSFASMHNLHA